MSVQPMLRKSSSLYLSSSRLNASQSNQHASTNPNVYQDAWLKSFENNHVPTNPNQKLFLLGASSVLSLLNTHRGDLVGVVGETLSSTGALGRAVCRLRETGEGQDVLSYKPRVLYSASKYILQVERDTLEVSDEDIVNHSLTLEQEQQWLQHLLAQPAHTLAHQYGQYMTDHGYTPSGRYMVRFVDDPELAYVMQRYREVHDFMHVLTDIPPTVKGELALKALEFLQTELPMNLMSVLAASPVKLSIGDNLDMVTKGLPWARRTHNAIMQQTQNTGLLGIFFERYWDDDVNTLRSRYGIYEQCPI